MLDVFELDADLGRDAGFVLGDAVDRVGFLHRAFLVGDDDELAAAAAVVFDFGELADHRVVDVDIGFVQRGIDFVEDAERAGFGLIDRKEQRDRGKGFFAAGQLGDDLGILAGWAGDDLETGFERIDGVALFVLLFEFEIGPTAVEQFPEQQLEIGAHLLVGCFKQLAADAVEVFDGGAESFHRAGEVGELLVEEILPRLDFGEFIDGCEIDRAKRFEFAFGGVQLFTQGVEIEITRTLIVAKSFGQIELMRIEDLDR